MARAFCLNSLLPRSRSTTLLRSRSARDDMISRVLDCRCHAGIRGGRSRAAQSARARARSGARRQAGENRRVVAPGREQHKAVPDGVLKAQLLPGMKERAQGIENAADCEQPQARARENGRQIVVSDDPAPSQQKVESNGEAVEPAGKRELQEHAEERTRPDADGETRGSKTALHQGQEGR